MIEHDGTVGKLLKALDDLNIADNTIVLYTTDNGPHMNTWPDGAMTPFRSEKNTNWEGAFRVPCMIRWPGHIKPGKSRMRSSAGLDWFPTLLAAAGEHRYREKLRKRVTMSPAKPSKSISTAIISCPTSRPRTEKAARENFIYFNDDGDLVAFSHANWKVVFEEQRAPGTLGLWAEPFTKLGGKFYDLHADPFERADITSNTYWDWLLDHA